MCHPSCWKGGTYTVLESTESLHLSVFTAIFCPNSVRHMHKKSFIFQYVYYIFNNCLGALCNGPQLKYQTALQSTSLLSSCDSHWDHRGWIQTDTDWVFHTAVLTQSLHQWHTLNYWVFFFLFSKVGGKARITSQKKVILQSKSPITYICDSCAIPVTVSIFEIPENTDIKTVSSC